MNVRDITSNIINNYDVHTNNLIYDLQSINCKLYITKFNNFRDHFIIKRKTYACGIIAYNNNNSIKFPNVYPVMIGSTLDIAIRKLKRTVIEDLDSVDNIIKGDYDWETVDIGITCFLINGVLKQIPFFVTNDTKNIHVLKNTNLVCLYRYDENEKGTQLVLDLNKNQELSLRNFQGEVETKPAQRSLQKFIGCAYPVDMTVLMMYLFINGIDIDHLGNKITFTPGHLLYQIFRKNMWFALKNRDDPKSTPAKKALIIKRIIDQGDFLPVLSKKTMFGKINEQNREITGNQVFVEKKTTCYRDLSTQNYPLIPYLSQTVYIKISNKVKTNQVLSYKPSYTGYFCILGTCETKNVGRAMLLVRNVRISCVDKKKNVYDYLNVELDVGGNKWFLVVNSACISVTKKCWDGVDASYLKRKLDLVEVYVSDRFKFINYKTGILFKQLGDLWYSPQEQVFSKEYINEMGFPFLTSHYVDIIPHFNHNAFPKNILALNSLKHSILSLTAAYHDYFKDTLSAYCFRTECHEPIFKNMDAFSKHWEICLPKVKATFASFRGLTQEDCIVVNKKTNPFACVKLYVLKFKFRNKGLKYFRPMSGLTANLLGTVTCIDSVLCIQPQTMHVRVVQINPNTVQLFCNKKDYKIKDYIITKNYLFITITRDHTCINGDKLCSLHGQKGVMYVVPEDELPYALDEFGGRVVPDILINPCSLVSRQTMGQILEMKQGGKDYERVYNCKDVKKKGAALIGKVWYYLVDYLSVEHLYIAEKCNKDTITNQAVKGRSRQGGLRAGQMEFFSGFRANGLASCYEEKLLDDTIEYDRIMIPKSYILCKEDAKMYKCDINIKKEDHIEEI